MAAGVHLAGHGGGVGKPCVLQDRQRVHVGAQADDTARRMPCASLDHAHHARLSDAGCDLVAAEAAQLLGDERSRAMHVVEQFRVLVEVAAPGGDLVVKVGNAVDDGHGNLRMGRRKREASAKTRARRGGRRDRWNAPG
jgi:hypothetical protein